MTDHMLLSRLQKYILMKCWSKGERTTREFFYNYYKAVAHTPSHDDQVNSVTKAIERLIDRELMVGYGVRTPHKWYIKEVKLTTKGRKLAKKLIGEQQPLPLKS